MHKEPTAKERLAQLERQLAYWEANAEVNKAEQAEYARLRAAGKMPSIVDNFDVQKYQRSVAAFNARRA